MREGSDSEGVSDNDEWVEVEKLLDKVKRRRDGRYYFLVAWLGGDTPTWEMEANIDSSLIVEFEEERAVCRERGEVVVTDTEDEGESDDCDGLGGKVKDNNRDVGVVVGGTIKRDPLIKKFFCEYEGCGKAYATRKSLNTHISRKHRHRGLSSSLTDAMDLSQKQKGSRANTTMEITDIHVDRSDVIVTSINPRTPTIPDNEQESCSRSTRSGRKTQKKVIPERVVPSQISQISVQNGENGGTKTIESPSLTPSHQGQISCSGSSVSPIKDSSSVGSEESRKRRVEPDDFFKSALKNMKMESDVKDNDIKVDTSKALLEMVAAMPAAVEALVKENAKLKADLAEFDLLQKQRLVEYEKLKAQKLNLEAERNNLKKIINNKKEEDEKSAAKFNEIQAEKEALEERNERLISYMEKHSSDFTRFLDDFKRSTAKM